MKNLNIETITNLTPHQSHELTELAAVGFGQPNSSAMAADTKAHLVSADILQVATIDDRAVGLAMYRRRLWQSYN